MRTVASEPPFDWGSDGTQLANVRPYHRPTSTIVGLRTAMRAMWSTDNVFSLSLFCGRPDYVAGGPVLPWSPVRTGESGHITNHSDASQWRSDSSVFQIGVVRDASVMSEISLAWSAANLVFVL